MQCQQASAKFRPHPCFRGFTPCHTVTPHPHAKPNRRNRPPKRIDLIIPCCMHCSSHGIALSTRSTPPFCHPLRHAAPAAQSCSAPSLELRSCRGQWCTHAQRQTACTPEGPHLQQRSITTTQGHHRQCLTYLGPLHSGLSGSQCHFILLDKLDVLSADFALRVRSAAATLHVWERRALQLHGLLYV